MTISQDFIHFSRPSIGEAEIAAATDVLKSLWITTGPKCQEFERAFAAMVGTGHALALTSATAGLHLALALLDLKPGDEVVVPAFNWVSTANMVRLLGASPVFVDVLEETQNIDPEDLVRVIGKKTRAVVPVHFAGRAYDFDGVRSITAPSNISIIDDAAHAVGTIYDGRAVGSLADISCFSFHPIKNITTAEGGMLTYNDDDVDRKLRLLKFHGISRDAFKRYSSLGLPHYDIAFPGYKYNMPDILAAIGIVQLARLEQFNQRREYLANRYDACLKHLGVGLPPPENRPGCRHSWHLYVIRIGENLPMSRDDLLIELGKRNIGAGIHFMPVHTTTAYSDGHQNLPVTEKLGTQVLSLPLYPDLTDQQQDVVIEQLYDIFKA